MSLSSRVSGFLFRNLVLYLNNKFDRLEKILMTDKATLLKALEDKTDIVIQHVTDVGANVTNADNRVVATLTELRDEIKALSPDQILTDADVTSLNAKLDSVIDATAQLSVQVNNIDPATVPPDTITS